ncbi:hypothetical protein ES703_62900 [subsurface metagenome]
MNDKGSFRTLAGRLFQLVGPAAVISHGVAIEQRAVPGSVAGIVYQQHHGLTPHVQTLVIVPAILGCHDAIACENHIGSVQGNPFHRSFRPRGILLTINQAGGGLITPDQQTRAGIDRHLHQGYLLEIAVPVAGLQAQISKFLLEKLESEFLPFGGRPPPFEFIGGQDGNVRRQVPEGDTAFGVGVPTARTTSPPEEKY